AFDGLDTVFLPCPYLGRYIIKSSKTFLFGPLGYPEIEPRIIDENNNIGPIGRNICFTKFDVFKNSAKISKHFPKPHEGKVAIMLDKSAAGFFHQIAAPKPKIGLLILFF